MMMLLPAIRWQDSNIRDQMEEMTKGLYRRAPTLRLDTMARTGDPHDSHPTNIWRDRKFR
jgi:hypothetical protein